MWARRAASSSYKQHVSFHVVTLLLHWAGAGHICGVSSAPLPAALDPGQCSHSSFTIWMLLICFHLGSISRGGKWKGSYLISELYLFLSFKTFKWERLYFPCLSPLERASGAACLWMGPLPLGPNGWLGAGREKPV